MAIFECYVRGAAGVRLVKATSAAQARDHIVSAKAIGAERMSDLIDDGAKLEKATGNVAADPSSYAPGGPLHSESHGADDEATRDNGQPSEAPVMETPVKATKK